MKAEIGIIGGTGIYDPAMLEDVEEIEINTPYGNPSDKITIGLFQGCRVAFLPRHGKKHEIPPHMINSRANIHALKELGVTRILAPKAVGSLKEEYKPGDLVLADQFIDRTWNRPNTFYDGPKVCHISVADPMCPELREKIFKVSKSLGFPTHEKGTYVCVQGPRFSTKAESSMFRQWNADILGMTLVPECVLAREAEICYASIAMVTDYDVWKDHSVTFDMVVQTMNQNNEKVKQLLAEVIPKLPDNRSCNCGKALEGALI